ncbi:MAG: hypothetical protein EOP86_11925 [Verrucomicrobiaceae bacterium]|nr:MAG: hypothetical protein EOP86_11925 [Verrucomicrobiaceae bacterium]
MSIKHTVVIAVCSFGAGAALSGFLMSGKNGYSPHSGNNPNAPAVIPAETRLAGTRQESAPAAASPSVKAPKKLSEVTGMPEEFEDRQAIEEMARSHPEELINWTLSLPDTLLKRQRLYHLACLALAGSHPDRLTDLVGRSGPLFSKLNGGQQISVMSYLNDGQLRAFQQSAAAIALDMAVYTPNVETVRDIREHGFDHALKQAAGASTELPRRMVSLMEHLPDRSPETLRNIYAQLTKSAWWGMDDSATSFVSRTMAKYDGELAVREGLKIPGFIGQSASSGAFNEWFQSDPGAALDFLPKSGVTDSSTLITWLHSILKNAKDPEIAREAQALLNQIQNAK